MKSVRGWLGRPHGLIAVAVVGVLLVASGIAVWWPVARRVDSCGLSPSLDSAVPGGCGGVTMKNDLGHALSGLGLLTLIGLVVLLLWRANVRFRSRLRWPFRASLALLLCGLVGWAAVPAAASAWQSHEDRVQEAAWRQQYEPAVQLLAALPAPAGLTPSSWNKTGGGVLMNFQWNGEVSPHTAALSFKTALRRAGAAHPEVRCQRSRKLTLCRVDARIGGVEVEAIVTPQLSNLGSAGQPVRPVVEPSTGNKYHGAEVTVDLPMSFPPSGAWLRVPVE